MLAANQNHPGVIDVLLGAGARADIQDNQGNTPLHVAARHNHIGILGKLVEKAPLTIRSYKDGRMPLHTAAIYGKEHAAELLVESGAPLSARTTSGRTALDLAKAEKWTQVEHQLKRHERRSLSERKADEHGDEMQGASDPRAALLAQYRQDPVTVPMMLTATAAFVVPYLLFVLLRSAQKRRGLRSVTN